MAELLTAYIFYIFEIIFRITSCCNVSADKQVVLKVCADNFMHEH